MGQLHSISVRNVLIGLAALALVSLLIFSRFYKLDQSLFFQNDIGRDFLTLQTWSMTGKPPLLGPQTGALPFNQSPIYFYQFYPVFLLTNQSYFATICTLVLVELGFLFVGLYVVRNHQEYQLPILTTALLLCLQPEVIRESRFIWNPSFLPPFLIASFFLFYHLTRRFSNKTLVWFSLSIGMAVGMSVSAIPIVIIYLLLSLFIFPRKFFYVLIGIVIATLLVFLPVLFFELKYHFQLTQRLLSYHQTVSTLSVSLNEKIQWALRLLFQQTPIMIFAVGCVISFGVTTFLLIKKPDQRFLRTMFGQSVVLFLGSLSVVLLLPFQPEAHYLMDSIVFLLLAVATQPKKLALAGGAALASFWLMPLIFGAYFQPAPRTVSQTEACFVTFCKDHSEPMYVTNQSGEHNFHTAREFSYIMQKVGCHVVSLDTQPTASNKMAVVGDGAKYTAGQTSFDELTRFGTASVAAQLACSKQLNLTLLQR